ncbi:phasin family protein [Plantactinospora sp. KLBMP9567]|uniref:phasin family protein n=1 Tax=Plantactinospora sp. KLBMP9567 TaxID=3085900 RepID=UPI00298294ED|nr:histone H1-like repetitive region-containing protein [Plantactinospora sp. KLBMP9567]MDW5330461.1 histone H1-like repetitive region-containing protein [Plantactinospora sp. KLBMP9567]
MQDAWRAYLELALGLTEASKKRAQAAARKLVGSGGATAAQLQTMAEELLSTGMANREALIRIVRVEIDRTLAAVGLATADDVTALTDRVARLERELSAARSAAPGGTVGAAATATAADGIRPPAPGVPAGTGAADESAVAKKAVAKKAVAKKAVAKKAVAKKAVAKKAVAKKAVAKKAVAKKTVAKKTVAKKAAVPEAVAKQAVVKKAVAKKAAGGKAVATKRSTPGKAVAKRSPAPGGGVA